MGALMAAGASERMLVGRRIDREAFGVGTGASTAEEQTLDRELAEARALIEQGEYEGALDRLEGARRLAGGERAVLSLGEIESLARSIWLRAPTASDITRRGGHLLLALKDDMHPSPPQQAQRSPLAVAGWLVFAVVQVVVGISWISSAVFFAQLLGWNLGLVLSTVVGGGLFFLGAVVCFARCVTVRVPRWLVLGLWVALGVAVGIAVAVYETSRGSPPAQESSIVPDRAKPVIGRIVTFGQPPVAGKRLVARFDVMRSTGGPMLSGTMVCTPTVAGKVIPHTESLISGSAWLFASIPRTAKGKLLPVAVTIRANGWSANRVARVRIR